MAKKSSRKRLGQDVKPKDILLLDRPEVEIIRDVTEEQKLRRAPKGKYLLVREKKSKEEYTIFIGNDEKVDCTYRPGLWAKIKAWLDNNHKTYIEKPVAKVLPAKLSHQTSDPRYTYDPFLRQ